MYCVNTAVDALHETFYVPQFLIIVFILSLKSNRWAVFELHMPQIDGLLESLIVVVDILSIPYLRSIICKVSIGCIREEKKCYFNNCIGSFHSCRILEF